MAIPEFDSNAEINDAIKNHTTAIIIFADSGFPSENNVRLYEKVSKDYPSVYVGLLNTDSDDHKTIAQDRGVGGVPFQVGYKDGSPIESYLGPQDEDMVHNFFKRLL